MKRVYDHKSGAIPGFTKEYKVHNLVYYETTSDVSAALTREKQLKKWNRAWKLQLIEKTNPAWDNLSEKLI